MKCVILCSGYATRLYPLTLNKPKPLLPIKGKPILDYLVKKVEKIEDIDEIFVVSNEKFYNSFLKWRNSVNCRKKIKIINDKTSTNETRLGGVGDLVFAIEKENIKEDLLVLLGDNYFNFDLNKIIDFFKEKKSNVIGLFYIKETNKCKNFGILQMNKKNQIISFEEKPENPKSHLISAGIYVYSKKELKKIKEYLKTESCKEGPGYLIPYFKKFQKVYGFVLEGFWYDIGDKETYGEVNK
jgi:glucose-1-phosphate thymidylyltransferase